MKIETKTRVSFDLSFNPLFCVDLCPILVFDLQSKIANLKSKISPIENLKSQIKNYK